MVEQSFLFCHNRTLHFKYYYHFKATLAIHVQTSGKATKNPKMFPSKPPHHLLSPLPIGNYEFGATYESLECDDLHHHYAYPPPSPPDTYSSPYNNYTYITVRTPPADRRTSKNYVYSMDEDLYHAIGPDTGIPPGPGSKLGGDPATSAQNCHEEAPAASSFYHVLDATGFPAAQYEDPTATNFRVCFT